jgi:RNA polymerase sigma-70 factor (ECF subfamily)
MLLGGRIDGLPEARHTPEWEGRVTHADPEGEAIRRCRAGEAAGLEWLVQHYQVSATDLAFLLSGDSALAEDIVQESFLTLLRIIGRFQPGKPFAPWFMGIVANTARQRKYQRQRGREISLHALAEAAEPLLHDHDSDPAEHAERDERAQALLQALEQLSPKQREAVVLRYYGAQHEREIAQIVGCSYAAARQRIHDGLLALEHIIRTHYPWLIDDAAIVPLFSETVPEPPEAARHEIA